MTSPYLIAISPLDETLLRRLDTAGYRLTEPRKMLLRLISSGRDRFTAADLWEAVQREAPGLGRATVFRTLDLLSELGILQRVHFDDASCHSYVVCGRSHHHHLVCGNCGRVIDFEQSEVEELLHRLTDRLGFQIESHHLEVYGRCKNCKA